MIKVIAFDFGDVILEGPFITWLKENPTNDFDKRWEEYLEHAHKWDAGEMTLDQVYEITSKFTGIPKDLIWEQLYEKAKLNKELVEIIRRLKRNIKLLSFQIISENNYDDF